jgi:hypothetical protein
MSLFPKTEWKAWAAEWGLQHHPQESWLYRDERVVGMRDGRLVDVSWSGQNKIQLVILVRFPRVESVQRVRDALIADPALDSFPGKGAKRRRMVRDDDVSKIRKRRPLPEFTLGERNLIWARRFPFASPKPAQVRKWVETLLSAVGRATQPFDGHCEKCHAASVRGFVLVDSIPTILCGTCQQRLLAEGDLAERSYDLQTANHLGGSILGLCAAFVGAVVWAAVEVMTGYIYAALAMAMGLAVARAYRRGAGRIDGLGRVIGAALTLGSVVLGDILIITATLLHKHPGEGVPFVRAMELYASVAAKSPYKLAPPLLFGLFGVWVSTVTLRRPKLKADIRAAGEDPRKAQRKAA